MHRPFESFIALMKVVKAPPCGDAGLIARADAIREAYSCRKSADAIYIALAEYLESMGKSELVTFDTGIESQARTNARLRMSKSFQLLDFSNFRANPKKSPFSNCPTTFLRCSFLTLRFQPWPRIWPSMRHCSCKPRLALLARFCACGNGPNRQSYSAPVVGWRKMWNGLHARQMPFRSLPVEWRWYGVTRQGMLALQLGVEL